MQLFGYIQGTDTEEPMPLQEVTVVATPRMLRRLADFLLHTAAQIERHGPAFGHEHFGDFDREVPSQPAFIVARPSD